MISRIISSMYSSVAPFTGAWIEISLVAHAGRTLDVAPFTGAWIEILGSMVLSCRPARRSLHGSVDWNYEAFGDGVLEARRSLHGSVD